MISHDRAQELISSRLDGPLDPVSNRALLTHLATCPACRRFAENSEMLARGLRDLPHLTPSPRVSRGVMERIEGGRSFWPSFGRFRLASSPVLAVASTLVLIAALAFTIRLALNPPGDGGPERQGMQGMQTAPVLDWYRTRGTRIAMVDAVGDVDAVTQRARIALEG